MGRFYHGDINGKYWVAVQSSACMENYGGKNLGSEATFACCGCSVHNKNGDPYIFEMDDSCFGLPEKIYCWNCYDSYEEHIAEIHEENGMDEGENTYYVDQEIHYSMNQDDFEEYALPFIKKHRCLWERFVEKIEFNEDFEIDNVTFKNHLEEETKSIIADLCMLKQIQHYFKETGDYQCDWVGEY